MRRTGKLAIDNLVKVLGVGGIGRFHLCEASASWCFAARDPIRHLALA
jgi:hypothetical protein